MPASLVPVPIDIAASHYTTHVRAQLALIISCYLGVAGESGLDFEILVGGVAALCPGVAKQVLKMLSEKPEIMITMAP